MKNKEKGLSSGHLTMMALGSVIGGSFFLGSSVAIHAAGPAVLISYILCGVVVHYILYALSEMTISNPDSGSFRTFAAKAFGQGAGFVVGWVYWTGMVLAMSSEATAISILVRSWYPNLSVPILGSIIIVFVTIINLLGASKLSKLESALAGVKIFAIVFFIIMALMLIIGLFPGKPAVGLGALTNESLFPGGFFGVAGSLLVVMFAYAGFEVIGLAASETDNPKKAVPKAIRNTVLSLLGLYIVSYAVILPLIPTNNISEEKSPMAAALNSFGIGWAGTAINIVLITAILSTMLGAMFGLGRMMRSLADEGLAPAFLKDKNDVPYRGILVSGFGMLAGLLFALLSPKIYIFLISSGGFALLFTYIAIMATHIRFRMKSGKPAAGEFNMRGFPYSSVLVLFFLVATIISMPFIPGQLSGLIAGCIMLMFYSACFLTVKLVKNLRRPEKSNNKGYRLKPNLQTELSKELTDTNKKEENSEG